MTTYTLTAEQRGQLMTDLAKAYISSEALSMLHSLQPNTQEPALYQSRIRPAWKDDADWLAWETCSKESAEDYERTPLLHDWQYQVRRLYAHPAPQPSTQSPVCSVIGVDEYGPVFSWHTHWAKLPIETKLYTHPAPQAKPLTDEQIKRIWLDITESYVVAHGAVKAITRAIEAAHNIGVKQ